MGLPIIEPVPKQTTKVCNVCGSNHDMDVVYERGVIAHGFIWWNCPCGGTLVEREPQFS